MGLQLIFVVETSKKCKSDWIYIKDTVEHFYQYDKTKTKLTPVYMDGKGKYKKKEKEISGYINQYSSGNKNNQSKVIFCFDCDNYDCKPEDAEFLANAKRYCDEKEYEFIWFCKDIERVYLGKKVDDSQKMKAAAKFKEKKLINTVDERMLAVANYRENTSNIMNIIDKYLTRK